MLTCNEKAIIKQSHTIRDLPIMLFILLLCYAAVLKVAEAMSQKDRDTLIEQSAT